MTTSTATDIDLSTLSISDIVRLMPEDADWTIANSQEARVIAADGRRGVIYWDTQDADNTGWAYQIRATETTEEESGELNTAADLIHVFG